MITIKILIDSVEKVKKLTSILSKEDVDCEVVEGVHIIDAKSIMGLFSIDLAGPVQLNIHSDDQSILDNLKEFIVE
ncbi:PTS sugar transporter [Clostridium minihomine]|uniref:PTS sugar transporter n=1 Tax=Clostridium minihomine TaxID=2045012 RepID=UPI000C77D683|nr:PTS sugar transporter [Clostridium minihomine]